jgi:NitT/TauT family transport system substrate-binding protein
MKRYLMFLVLAFAALLSACSSKGTGPYPLKIAYVPHLCHAPMHVAVEKGFFEAEGIKPEMVQIDSGHVQEALGSGQLDVGAGLISKFLQPIENGLPVKFVAGLHTGCIKVLTKKDAGIASIKDLKGKRIGVPGLADATTYLLKRALILQGVSVDEKNPEVEFVVFSRNDLPQALQKGAVDVIALVDPAAAIAEKAFDLKVLLDSGKTPPFDTEYCCAVFVAARLAKEHPEIAAGLTRAILKASAWVQAHPEEAAKIQLDKKYVAGDLEVNTKLLRGYNYKPSVKGGYEAVYKNAQAFAQIGLLKQGTDAKAFADKVYLFQQGVPDTYTAAEVANVK